MKLSSSKTEMNVLTAEVVLVVDEFAAEFIRLEHIQDVVNFEADALGRLSHGASVPASLVSATCLLVLSRDDAVYEALGYVECHARRCVCFVSFAG